MAPDRQTGAHRRRNPRARRGQKMHAAAQYVRDHPGCSKWEAARAVSTHGSNNAGYRIIDRAVKAGMIIAERQADGSYRLTPPPGERSVLGHRRPRRCS